MRAAWVRGSALGFALAVAVLFGACTGDDDAATPAGSASGDVSTADEVLARMTEAMTRDGSVFHTVASVSRVDGTTETPMLSTEAWIDLNRDHARLEVRKAPGFEADMADYTLSIVAGGWQYTDEGDLRPSQSFADDRDRPQCLDGTARWIVRRVACGFMNYPAGAGPTVDTNAHYEGHDAVTLTTRYHREPEPGSEIPTPQPGEPDGTKPYDFVYSLFVDRTTFLPIAATAQLEQDGVTLGIGGATHFENSFVKAESLAADFLEPSAVGYVPPEELERRALEDPALPVPVYWLGRSFDPGHGLPVLKLTEVDTRSLLPGQGPGSALGIYYASDGGAGRVGLEVWPPGAWEAFQKLLGARLVWAECSDTSEFDVPGGHAVIRRGHEPTSHGPEGGVYVLTPGVVPTATPSPTPIPASACPKGPPDRFMAEVHYADVGVTLQAPLATSAQEGKPFGVFDDEGALKQVIAGLRLRHAGE
jgi:hypothetical protein